MTEIPFRGLGTLGLNSDIDPRSLPALPQAAWTEARNVRFEKGSITRGPRFRLNGTISRGQPVFVQGHAVPNGNFETLVGFIDGTVYRINARDDLGGPCLETPVHPIEHLPFDYPAAMTACTLQDVIYLNRPDHRLWAMMKNGERFEVVKNWGEDWRCRAIRSVNGTVVAIGVARNGRTYPTMVKTSDFAAYGSSEQEWVSTTENSASENILGGLGDRLVDGCELRGRMYLYTETETWSMTPSQSNNVNDYSSAFNWGVISQNCVVNVLDTHYCFGPTGLWTHDGTSPKPLSKGRFDTAVYKDMVLGQKHQFYVIHNPRKHEVMFCFVSNDPKCRWPVGAGKVPFGWPDYPGCNKALTYNYAYDTAAIDDLPYLVGGAVVSPFGGTRWEELKPSWADLKGTWYDFGDHTPPAPLFVSSGAPAIPALNALDDTVANVTLTSSTILTAGQITTNDSGQAFAIVAVGPAEHGTVELLGNGGVRYDPPALTDPPITEDSFPYTIRDFYGQEASATVHLTFPAPSLIQAVDDAITVESVKGVTATGYRSNSTYNAQTLLFDYTYFEEGEQLEMFGAPLLPMYQESTTVQDVIDAFNTKYGAQGYRMLIDAFDEVVPAGEGFLAVVRTDPFISDADRDGLNPFLWGATIFVVHDLTPVEHVSFMPVNFLANDTVNGTTKITSITQPVFSSATLNLDTQVISYQKPRKVANGTSYGNVYNDNFTYTIEDASGARSTANVAVTIDNGLADTLKCPKVATIAANRTSYGSTSGSLGLVYGSNNPDDPVVGSLLVMWVKGTGSTTWTVEDGWDEVASTPGLGGLYTRIVDAAYLAKMSDPKYVGDFGQPYPFVSSPQFDTIISVMSFNRPNSIPADEFLVDISFQGILNPTGTHALVYSPLSDISYRYTFIDVIGVNGAPPTIAKNLPVQEGEFSYGDLYNIEAVGEVNEGAYPEAIEVSNASRIFAVSFVLKETSCAPQ